MYLYHAASAFRSRQLLEPCHINWVIPQPALCILRSIAVSDQAFLLSLSFACAARRRALPSCILPGMRRWLHPSLPESSRSPPLIDTRALPRAPLLIRRSDLGSARILPLQAAMPASGGASCLRLRFDAWKLLCRLYTTKKNVFSFWSFVVSHSTPLQSGFRCPVPP